MHTNTVWYFSHRFISNRSIKIDRIILLTSEAGYTNNTFAFYLTMIFIELLQKARNPKSEVLGNVVTVRMLSHVTFQMVNTGDYIKKMR